VKVLVLAALVLCMSAPEELFYSQTETELNPFTGSVKLVLLGLTVTILFLCRTRRRQWAIAEPFRLLIAWAIVCWLVSGAGVLPARNLVSSFGGILVLAAFCAATEYIGVRTIVRILVWALLITTVGSVILGILGLQPMPGESRLPGDLEWFHGVGLPGYAVAGCAVLIAWVLACYLSGTRTPLELALLALLVIPALVFLRAYLAGILVSVLFAAAVAIWRARIKFRRLQPARRPPYKRLLFLAVVSFACGAVVFAMKAGIRAEGGELSGREIIWPIEIASIIQHPISGLGPFGDVELLRFKEDLPQLGAAHSDYLAAAVCYGVPGLFLFVYALYSLWGRVLRFRPVNVEEYACRYAALFSLAALLTTIIAENVIRDPRLFSLYLLFPAICLSSSSSRYQKAVR
jgi:O-antigen ligase